MLGTGDASPPSILLSVADLSADLYNSTTALEATSAEDQPQASGTGAAGAASASEAGSARSLTVGAPVNFEDRSRWERFSMQARLAAIASAATEAQLITELGLYGTAGKAAQAQLRSQRGPGATDWLDASSGDIHTVCLATRLLVYIFADAWVVEGATCPFPNCPGEPTGAHAMGCTRQHIRGPNAVHTGMKRALQRALRDVGIGWVGSEEKGIFELVGGRDFSADTVIWPLGLACSANKYLQHRGIIIDTSVRSATSSVYTSPVGRSSATVDGYAAAEGEKQKERHHKDCIERSRWAFVPSVQETDGRFGHSLLQLMHNVATHAGIAAGGTQDDVAARTCQVEALLRRSLSIALAREQAERVIAYARGAALAGRRVTTTSTLLSQSGPQD